MDLSQEVARVFHTVRHLRPVQITNRVRRRLIRPRFGEVVAPPCRSLRGPWTPSPARPATLIGNDRVRVFQDDYAVAHAADWNAPLPALVVYNLHYFDDLTAADAAQRRPQQLTLIGRWIDQNPPGQGAGWEPYPLSLRIVNWIKWQLAGGVLTSTALQSLATQTEALASQLEFHLLGNHLLANAKGLLLAGCFFQGATADRWRELGLRVPRHQLPEQILPDGGHFELSPMYHSLILEDLLDLWNLQQVYADLDLSTRLPGLRDQIAAMRSWLATMCHPDGEISFFNDAACGVAIAPVELDAYATRLGLGATVAPADGVTHLASSGYVRLQAEDAVVLLDVAELGPAYQPGHAHADTLSFEWSHRGRRVIVNSGTSCYGSDAERLRQRSTAAHATVEVDRQDSSEVWSGFRVARRARPRDLQIDQQGSELTVACAHDGYLRLPGKVVHHRRWALGGGQLKVEDQLSGRFDDAVGRFFLHPSVRPVALTETTGELDLDQLERLRFYSNGAQLGCQAATYHPRFGVSQANFCLESAFLGPAHQLRFEWQ